MCKYQTTRLLRFIHIQGTRVLRDTSDKSSSVVNDAGRWLEIFLQKCTKVRFYTMYVKTRILSRKNLRMDRCEEVISNRWKIIWMAIKRTLFSHRTCFWALWQCCYDSLQFCEFAIIVVCKTQIGSSPRAIMRHRRHSMLLITETTIISPRRFDALEIVAIAHRFIV